MKASTICPFSSVGLLLAPRHGVNTQVTRQPTSSANPTSASHSAHALARIGLELPGGYALEALLGSGGMGAVYLARQHSLDRYVAIKMMHTTLSGQPDALARFLVEARATSQLGHANTVRVFDFGQTGNDEMFLVMEYIEGPTLSDLARHGALSPLAAIELVIEVLGALEEAHEAGILHRDLKPDNVLVTTDRQGTRHVKVVDFGLAKVLEKGGASRPKRPSLAWGTPGFMSPEQQRGETVDRKSDLFAVGAILVQLVTGRLLGEMPTKAGGSKAGGSPSITQTHLRRVSAWPEQAPALADLLARATSPDPAERPASARAFAEELAEIRHQLQSAARAQRAEAPTEAERAPLIGRERELAMVLDYALSRRPTGQLVAIRGALGSGRTRLLDEIVGAAHAAGRFVVRVGADPLGIGVSGAVLAEVARQLVAPHAQHLSATPRSTPKRRVRNGDRRRANLVDATARLLLGVAQRTNGVLLAIDDFGEIDSLSRAVLLDLIERGLPADTAVVLTADASHPRDLAGERSVKLEPLSGPELSRLCPEFDNDEEALPLAAVLRNTACDADGGASSAWALIGSSLRSLPDAARRALEAACIDGIDGVTGLEELPAAAEALERSRLAAEASLVHPLVRAVVLQDLAPARRRELATIALRLATANGERPEVLAHHAAAAGDAFTALLHLDRIANWRADRGDRGGAVAALASAVDVARSERRQRESQLPDPEGAFRYFSSRLAVARTR